MHKYKEKTICTYCHSNAMKDLQQTLEKLKLFLQYLQQDPTHNRKVAQHVQEKIRQLEVS